MSEPNVQANVPDATVPTVPAPPDCALALHRLCTVQSEQTTHVVQAIERQTDWLKQEAPDPLLDMAVLIHERLKTISHTLEVICYAVCVWLVVLLGFTLMGWFNR